MKTIWKTRKLGKLATFRNGINYSKDNFGEGISVINVRDFQDYIYPKYETLDEINPSGVVKDSHILTEDDILFVRSNGNRELIGRSLYIYKVGSRKITHSAFTIRVRFHSPNVYPKFYRYLFKSTLIRQILSAWGGGTNISNLNQQILTNLDVPFPPLSIQKKIAAILSAYDDLIENNNHRIALLERAAEELYREWFVRMRFPGWETTKFENGLPDGWGHHRLADIALVVDCPHTKKPQEDEETDYKLLHVWNIRNSGRLDLSKTYNISPDDYNHWISRIEVQGGDCIITKTGRVGAVAQIPKGIKAALGRNLVGIRLTNYPNFLIQCLLSPHKDFNVATLKSSGVIMESLHVKAIENFKVQLPTSSLLASFEKIVGPIRNQIENLSNQNANLSQPRDLLLSRLISGKLPVEDLDVRFPPSMTETEEPAHA